MGCLLLYISFNDGVIKKKMTYISTEENGYLNLGNVKAVKRLKDKDGAFFEIKFKEAEIVLNASDGKKILNGILK